MPFLKIFEKKKKEPIPLDLEPPVPTPKDVIGRGKDIVPPPPPKLEKEEPFPKPDLNNLTPPPVPPEMNIHPEPAPKKEQIPSPVPKKIQDLKQTQNLVPEQDFKAEQKPKTELVPKSKHNMFHEENHIDIKRVEPHFIPHPKPDPIHKVKLELKKPTPENLPSFDIKGLDDKLPGFNISENKQEELPKINYSTDELLKPKKKEKFVSLENYNTMISDIIVAIENLTDADRYLGNVENTIRIRKAQLKKWFDCAEEIQRKLVFIDKKLFHSIGGI
ncbi:hypothetical protein D6745_01830 [Candidatus Woesearchaeota archaeon]|nr:MAG: hypothetical protein D6745_01830 [Candidatus Woesearchaeota archaeon]